MSESNVTTRFSNRVADYVRARPGYPPGVIDALRERIGLSPAWRVADIGAGTGISSRLFLEAGNSVVAVEPNDAMRDAAAGALRDHDGFTTVKGTAEATTLADASVRLVVAAQAFHWFDRAAFRNECLRILEPGGHVLLIWNSRKSHGTPFLERYEELLLRFGTDYASINHRNIGDEDIAAFFAPEPFHRLTFPNVQRFDFDGLRARLLSSSYAPVADDPRAGAMLAALRRIHDESCDDAGIVEMIYETELFVGKLS